MNTELVRSVSITQDPVDDKYRWYLCKETQKLLHWECEQVAQGELDKYKHIPSSRTIAIPIRRWAPSAADFMIINNALKQTFTVS
jgi:hypothetical protein